jgi:hypothetical protein
LDECRRLSAPSYFFSWGAFLRNLREDPRQFESSDLAVTIGIFPLKTTQERVRKREPINPQLIANETLYQLSYTPVVGKEI